MDERRAPSFEFVNATSVHNQDEDDYDDTMNRILNAEIEIIAQPPGKKTQTLRMLSAGEKALTAIALLFAIYQVKPSPFCILDEVDAPLDDNNILKFSNALKKISLA